MESQGERRGRRIALALSLVTLCMLGAGAFSLRVWIQERWYFYQYEKARGDERWAIAETLERTSETGRRRMEAWYLELLGVGRTAEAEGGGENAQASDANAERACSRLSMLGSLEGLKIILQSNRRNRVADGACLGRWIERGGGEALHLVFDYWIHLNPWDNEDLAQVLAGAGAEVVPLVRESLRMLEDPRCQSAAMLCVLLGLDAEPALPELIQILEKSPPWVQGPALAVMEKLLIKALPAAPQIARLVCDPESPLRRRALRLLHFFPVDPEIEIPSLRCALASSDLDLVLDALKIVQTLGPRAELLLPEVLRWFGSRIAALHLSAIDCLGSIGPGVKAFVPRLELVLEEARADMAANRASPRDMELRRRVRHAILSIRELGPKDEVTLLLRELSDFRAGVRYQALEDLRELSGVKSPPLATLEKLLLDEDGNVRERAASFLGQLGTEAESAIPALLEAKKNRHPGTKAAANAALELIQKAIEADVKATLK